MQFLPVKTKLTTIFSRARESKSSVLKLKFFQGGIFYRAPIRNVAKITFLELYTESGLQIFQKCSVFYSSHFRRGMWQYIVTFFQIGKFFSKFDIQSKFLSKIEISVLSRKFYQKLKSFSKTKVFWKIVFLAEKNRNFVKNRNIVKGGILSTNRIVVKKSKFCQKLNFC